MNLLVLHPVMGQLGVPSMSLVLTGLGFTVVLVALAPSQRHGPLMLRMGLWTVSFLADPLSHLGLLLALLVVAASMAAPMQLVPESLGEHSISQVPYNISQVASNISQQLPALSMQLTG